MEKILGYADRLSVKPGESIDFMVSAPAGRFTSEIHRIVSVDDRAGGPGWKSHITASDIDGEHEGELQSITSGSYFVAPAPPAVDGDSGWTVALAVAATELDSDASAMTLFARSGGGRGFRMTVAADGFAMVYSQADGTEASLRTTTVEPAPDVWYHLVFSVGPTVSGARRIELAVRCEDRDWVADELVSGDVAGFDVGSGPMVFAAQLRSDGRPEHLLEGKLTSPLVLEGAAASTDRERLLRDRTPSAFVGVAAAWDFARDTQSTEIADVSGNGLHGVTFQLPSRAVTGPRWTGRVHNFKDAPEQYDAIHFHSRDLADAGWRPTLSLTVPADWQSGAYAVKLEDGESYDWIPFYVRGRDDSQSKVLFLAPTNTYLAYANQQYDNDKAESALSLMKSTPIVGNANDVYISEHPELGLSLYDLHPDGVGVRVSSARRPILNWRPDYHNWLTDGPRHYTADFYILGWLDQLGIDADIATDEDLDREGLDLLSRYDVVITGSHPEYHSERMLDAIEQYTGAGGRLMYLGGNGFYWVTSYDPDRRHVIEVRRGYAGNGDFRSPVGEAYHATTGEVGGIWRLRGRTPNRLTGVGYGSNGWAQGVGYRRSQESRYSWVFAGIDDDEIIGDFGLVLGAAGGDEMDRADFDLGTPPQTAVLASTTPFTDHFQPVMDDYTVFVPAQGGSTNPKVRADITMFETDSGGAVFSTGSICWAGALAFGNYDNNVARLTTNALRGLLDFKDLGRGA